MQVKPTQLEPGCVLLNDVIGKTKYPIIPKQTVLTEKHIEILKGFLVKSVDVDHCLANGEPFEPKPSKEDEDNPIILENESISFESHFLQTVEAYKHVYNQIRSGLPINILEVRKLLIPLLERTDDLDRFIKRIHLFGNKKDYIYFHSVSVGLLSSYLARKLQLEKPEWIQIGLAGLLSDSGMAKIDQRLFYKEGPITKEERENQVTLHSTYSYRLVESLNTLTQEAKLGILQHHERLDGSGYPLGVNFGKIHKYAQIIAVSDVYHAIVSDRLYKEKKSPFKAIEELETYRIVKFRSEIVRHLTNAIVDLEVGDKVRLSDQRIGQVMFVDPELPVRPIVSIEHTKEMVSLKHTPNLHIEEVL